MPTNAISQQYTHHSDLWSQHNPNYQNQSSPIIKETIEKSLKLSKVISQRFVETIFKDISCNGDASNESYVMDLSSIRLDVKGIQTLADKLGQTSNIIKLILSNTTLPDYALTMLVKGILIKDKIEFLDISYNRITSIGAKEIANLIEQSSSIKFINASYNMLDYEHSAQNNGLNQILEALTSKSDIHFNYTTDYTAEVKDFIQKPGKTHKIIKKYSMTEQDLISYIDDNSSTDNNEVPIMADNTDSTTGHCHCVIL